MTGAVRMGAARTAAAGRAIRAGANASTEQQSASISVESIVISHSVSGNFLVFRLKVNWANAGASVLLSPRIPLYSTLKLHKQIVRRLARFAILK